MSHHFVVPNWNLRHQRQDQLDGGDGNRSSHVQNHQNPSYVVPMLNHEVAELTWENGQLAMHGLSNILPSPAPTKSTCGRAGDHTLESIVHQATCHHKHSRMMNSMQSQKHDDGDKKLSSKINSTLEFSGTKWGERSGQVQMLPSTMKKRPRSETESDQCGRFFSSKIHDLGQERSACASASATLCRDNNKDATMVTWASFESPSSFKTKNTTDEDSASHGGLENRDEEQGAKGGIVQSCSARRSRAAAVHNQSERRRRDRINQKMKALQKLVPNASKTDKASMLDEVIEYLKQLQAQVHMMGTRAMPQMMMTPLAMQQQLQMSLLARMGMGAGVGVGMGMGMLDINSMARTAPLSLQPFMHSTPIASAPPTFVPPPLVMPPRIPACTPPPATANATTTEINASGAFSDPYSSFLAQQTVNMDFYSKMAALFRQQANQTSATASNPLQPNFNQGK
ncbi:unnamed protein product [Coffea canephora]|uniref:DH200=94 genomic scaffold, scaffold_164 n=1 Tax=Coffea canephora TaxID=49390 RepID=A0A068V9P2_COFCA|nr:unnamed protein product [Coffea canephora]